MIDAMRAILATMLLMLIGACAMNEAQSSVAKSQGADIGSTALGLSMGLTEANPLGLALLPAKALVVKYADCETKDIVNYISYGAAGWNMALIAGAGGFIGIPIAAILYASNKKPCLTEEQRLRINWDKGYAKYLQRQVP